ncbi:MAG: hypothetical protein IJI60_05145 [Bacilli bacterium]|nr:hypothetical protein [Bacilli bacterium]
MVTNNELNLENVKKGLKNKKIIIAIVVILILIAIIVYILSNSKGAFESQLKKMGFTSLENEGFICDAIKKDSKLMMSTRKYSFIAINGEVYDITFNKQENNKQNCEKRDFSTKIKSYIDNIVVGEDGKYYAVYDNLAQKEDVSFNFGIDDVVQKNYQFFLKKDGNIYFQENPEDENIVLKYKKQDVKGTIQSFSIINSDYTENEERKIVILTDKAVYYTRATNKEKCKNYADVKCDYQLVKDKALSKFRKYILYVDDTAIITKDGKVLYVNDYFDKK